MKLLHKTTNGVEVVTSEWILAEDDADIADDATVAISYARYMRDQALWHERATSWTVQFEPSDELVDVSAEVLALPELLIAFPAFTDGRGYSQAATLSRQYDYAGTLIAVGDVRRDQLEFMHETGFNAFQITGNDTVEDMAESLHELQMPAHRLYSGAGV